MGFLTNSIIRQTALRRLINQGMVLEFFPAVAVGAAVLRLAAILVGACVLLLPSLALGVDIVKLLWRPSIVLPVVRVHTLIPLVLLVRHRTPNSFEMKHVKIHVSFHFVEHIDRQLTFMMCEGTQVPVLAAV
jgi:hypothetical protein